MLRERTLARQKELGVVPADAELTKPDEAFEEWDSLDETRSACTRQMEVTPATPKTRIGTLAGSSPWKSWSLAELDNRSSGSGATTAPAWRRPQRHVQRDDHVEHGIALTAEQQMGSSSSTAASRPGEDELEPPLFRNWALASNTPFQWGKQVASHLGGTRNPLVVRYPKSVPDAGGIRSQFAHVTDIAPTVLDLAGIPHPTHVDGIEQEPLHGNTFTASLADAGAPEHHTQQYFEAVGNRAMYKDGWWFAQRLQRVPWELDRRSSAVSAQAGTPTRTRLSSTTSPTTSPRRGTSRTRAREGRGFEAVLGGGGALQRAAAARRAQLALRHRPPIPKESKFTYRGRIENVPAGMIPRIYNHSYTISADLTIPDGGAEGAIVAASTTSAASGSTSRTGS